MTTPGDRVAPPSRVLLAIGTASYSDPAYRESEERASEPDSLSQSVPRSLLAVVEAFGQSRVDVKLPSPGYLLNPHPDDQLRQVLAEAGSSGDIITIYYTGHGEKFDREGYVLVTSDFTKTQRWRGFKVREVPELVVRRRDDGEIDPDQPLTLLILDCCFAAGGGLEVLRKHFSRGRTRTCGCGRRRERLNTQPQVCSPKRCRICFTSHQWVRRPSTFRSRLS